LVLINDSMRNFDGPPIDVGETIKSPEEQQAELRQYLQEYLELEDAEAVELIGVDVLPEQHREQFDFVGDKRLEKIQFGIVPADLWHKGRQPSESHVKKGLVLFNEEYFKGDDEIAWMTHELAHCARFEDADPEEYQQQSDTAAFDDLEHEVTYPNNQVEEYAFSKQFEFLKQKRISRSETRKFLEEYYEDADLPFLERLLDRVFA